MPSNINNNISTPLQNIDVNRNNFLNNQKQFQNESLNSNVECTTMLAMLNSSDLMGKASSNVLSENFNLFNDEENDETSSFS